MPAAEQYSVSPMPPRLAWFAPWRWFAHWRPWKRWTVAAVILLAAYVVSLEPMNYVLYRSGADFIPGIPGPYHVYLFVYRPLFLLRENWVVMDGFYLWEWEIMLAAFGTGY